MRQYLLIALLSMCGTVRGYGSGAPMSGCESMMPAHNGATAQTVQFPYTIQISATKYACEGEEIQVTINGTGPLRGFLCEPRSDPSVYETTGSLTISGDIAAQNNCGTKASLTHTNKNDKQSVSLVWKSSSAMDNVYIVCTIVKTQNTFWVKQKSSLIEYTTGGQCTDTDSGSGSSSTFSMTSSLYAICILLLGLYFIATKN